MNRQALGTAAATEEVVKRDLPLFTPSTTDRPKLATL